jgi:hypothetical protein
MQYRVVPTELWRQLWLMSLWFETFDSWVIYTDLLSGDFR